MPGPVQRANERSSSLLGRADHDPGQRDPPHRTGAGQSVLSGKPRQAAQRSSAGWSPARDITTPQAHTQP